MESGGLLAGAEFALVVEVHAVGDGGEAEGSAFGFHLGEEFVFAMEAALGVVAGVIRVGEFGGLEDLEGDVVLFGKGDRSGEFFAGEGGGVGDAGEHLGAEGLMGGVGEESGVGAAGVGDEDGAEVLEGLVEEGGFLVEVHGGDCSHCGVGCGLGGGVGGSGVGGFQGRMAPLGSKGGTPGLWWRDPALCFAKNGAPGSVG